MKIIFAGTPDFAAKHLEIVLHSKHEVLSVLTQPDRESGRGKKINLSPVKQTALDNDIDVYQPKYRSGSDTSSCIWTPSTKGYIGATQIWLRQYSCFPSA